jgi:hypothetical protein
LSERQQTGKNHIVERNFPMPGLSSRGVGILGDAVVADGP